MSANYISAIERGVSSGSISVILDICKVLNTTPNYIFNGVIDLTSSNDFFEIFDPETSIKYIKLKPDNQNFIKNTISHLYLMQIKR